MTDTNQTQNQTSTPLAGSTTLYDLINVILTDPKLEWKQKQKLIDELRKTSPASDRWTFRWAILILGLVVLLTIVALWVLSAKGQIIPDGLVAIGSGAAGGIAGLLTPGRDNGSQ
ncbi:MAG: hypothetical protein KAV87_57895 [Desulfobacteraceae bacterium]|nr:hypothetical protein [Desulfobacteraceae bacterium]